MPCALSSSCTRLLIDIGERLVEAQRFQRSKIHAARRVELLCFLKLLELCRKLVGPFAVEHDGLVSTLLQARAGSCRIPAGPMNTGVPVKTSALSARICATLSVGSLPGFGSVSDEVRPSV